VAPEGVLEPGEKTPGRGVYTCKRLQCFERALARRAFARTLRRPIRVEPELSRLYTDARNHG
jgi:predicted RNA-binding protein YlxR (DUF448 family)